MDWLNYHHLLYFYVTAREGSVVKASQELHLAQPTISGQIHTLENVLGEKLFQRSGRRLVLTEAGRLVYNYAEEIFSLGREMRDALKDRPTGKPMRLQVGVVNVMPKLIAQKLLEPVLRSGPIHLICREDNPEALYTELVLHRLDALLTDSPAPVSGRLRTFSHPLGTSPISFFAAPALARKLTRGFPRSLNGAPCLLPTDNCALRRSLEQWFATQGIKPEIIGEFEDSALLTVFGQKGLGAFAVHDLIAQELSSQHGVKRLGTAEGMSETFYLISAERRVSHPAVLALGEGARSNFGL